MGAAPWAVLIAAQSRASEAADAPPGVASLAQYGILGILGAALLWFAHRAYLREVQRADRLEAEVTRLNTVIQEQALPAVLAATDVVKDYHDLLRDQRHERHAMTRDGYAPAAGHADGGPR